MIWEAIGWCALAVIFGTLLWRIAVNVWRERW
jgi:hypothetical protein